MSAAWRQGRTLQVCNGHFVAFMGFMCNLTYGTHILPLSCLQFLATLLSSEPHLFVIWKTDLETEKSGFAFWSLRPPKELRKVTLLNTASCLLPGFLDKTLFTTTSFPPGRLVFCDWLCQHNNHFMNVPTLFPLAVLLWVTCNTFSTFKICPPAKKVRNPYQMLIYHPHFLCGIRI